MATVTVQSEYRDLPLEGLVESPANPRKSFDQEMLTELANFVAGNKIGVLLR